MAYDSRPDTHEHIAEVRGLLLGAAAELIARAHQHDRSKLTEPELEVFNEFTPKLDDLEYDSPEYHEARKAMGEGLKHHYSVNDHHPEHFREGIADMDLIQLVEMLCDWIASTCRVVNGNVHHSIDQNAERFGYGDELTQLLHNSVARLRTKGL